MEGIKRGFKKIKEHQIYLRKEIQEKTVGYILAAFSLVAGLAWNEAVKSLIDVFPHTWNSVVIKFIYAVIITVIIVIITVYLVKLIEKKEEEVK